MGIKPMTLALLEYNTCNFGLSMGECLFSVWIGFFWDFSCTLKWSLQSLCQRLENVCQRHLMFLMSSLDQKFYIWFESVWEVAKKKNEWLFFFLDCFLDWFAWKFQMKDSFCISGSISSRVRSWLWQSTASPCWIFSLQIGATSACTKLQTGLMIHAYQIHLPYLNDSSQLLVIKHFCL